MKLLKSIWPLLPFSLALTVASRMVWDAPALDARQQFIAGLALLAMIYFWVLLCDKFAHDPDRM